MLPLNLASGPAGISVRVQPVVLLNICDAFIRRNEGQERVIGTLLGSVGEGIVEVKNSYAVPHNESAESVSFVILMSFKELYFSIAYSHSDFEDFLIEQSSFFCMQQTRFCCTTGGSRYHSS